MSKTHSILVSGGLGYLGGRISKGLAETGYTVQISTRKFNCERPPWLHSGEVINLDMENVDSIFNACKGVDTVVHLAATNEIVSQEDPVRAMQVNAVGTLRLVQAAAQAKVKRFVYFSTAAVYGAPMEGVVKEDAPLKPIHPYAYSHRAAEDIVLAARGKTIPEVVIIRLSNGFGAPERKDVDRWTLVVNDLCRQAALQSRLVLKSSGEQLRDFIPLSDVVAAVSHLIELKDIEEPIFNVGGNCTLSIYEMTERIAKRCEKVTGKRPPIERPPFTPSKVIPLQFNIDRLLQTGFKLTGSWEKEIDDTLRLFIP